MTIRRFTAAAVALTLLAAGGCGGDEPTSATTATNRLEVVSWWTSGSEAAALDTLFTAFRRENPGVDAVNGAVAGGAGSQAIVALAKRLQRDDPPDVWQTFTGKSVQGYAGRGAVRDVSSVYAAGGLDAAMQPAILESLRRGGKPYGVPTGAHRSNVLWFNPAALTKAGVTPPAPGYPLATFLTDLAKLKAAGTAPLCLGGRDAFTTVELFENVLLSTIGAGGWRDMAADGLDWRSDRVEAALRSFGDLLTYADPAASGLTWDAATQKLTTGACAFESMNDSAYGELVAGGAREGTDFASVPFPGTDDTYLAVVDVFVAATRAENAKNALGFLSEISKPAVQVPFSKAKGSVPVLRTVDVSTLSPYQQNASKSLWSAPVLLSVAHGESMSPEFQEGFYNAVSTYVRTRDPGAFATDLEDAVSEGKIPPR
jgi:glucose/mannose transport system substrate-binding protein